MAGNSGAGELAGTLHSLQRLSPHDPYVQQMRVGFSSLHFDGLIEGQFRAAYLRQTLPRVRAALFAAAALIVLFTVMDWLIVPELRGVSMAVRFGIMLPFVLLALWVSFQTQHISRLPPATVAAALGVGWSALGLGLIAASRQVDIFFPVLVLTTIFLYTFLALRFRVALATGISILVGYFLVGLLAGVAVETFFYNLAFLLAANLIGAAGNYALEHSIRLGFLESRVLQELVSRDGLTGIANRRMFDEHIERVWGQLARENKPMLVVFVDVDHFKAFNDVNGHPAGDECLKRVAETLSDQARRPLDLAARFGGEEFTLMLAAPEREYAESVARNLCAAVRKLAVPHTASATSDVVTISVGAAYVTPGRDTLTPAQAIEMADEALYEAKKLGRDQAVFVAPEFEDDFPGRMM